MAANERELGYLLRQYVDNRATKEDVIEMLDQLRREGGDQALEAFMNELRQDVQGNSFDASVDWERIWDNILAQTTPGEVARIAPFRKTGWFRVAAAAAIVLMMGTGVFVWMARSPKNAGPVLSAFVQPDKDSDIAPGGNKAILTLANGSQILLDSASNGTLAHQGNLSVVKLTNGHLAYSGRPAGGQSRQDSALQYNTMSTPRGGQYRLTLPDGSEVWLNAASSIRFPLAFTGKDRIVEITGEVYFEVKKNADKPFHVIAGGMKVTVLGTNFNINAYKDEAAIKTTLLEGSVKVAKGDESTVLAPGQQAVTNEGIKVERNIDVDATVAWKEGHFDFKETDLREIMRQVMRWYDVDVVYQGDVTTRYFTADISRDKSLSSLLRILALSDVHYRLEGKTLIVLP